MWRGLALALLVISWSAASYAVESGEMPMTIVHADEKLRDRVVAWINDTPIYQQDPYFAVAVRAGDKILEGECDPQSAWETLPVFWKPGVEVQGRVKGHSLFLKRPNGVEIRFVILKRSAAPAEKTQ
jgi:hypothetical protein